VQAELLLAQSNAFDRNPVTPEAANEREPGVKQPENDRRAVTVRHQASASS
jgi:hypothetical protein